MSDTPKEVFDLLYENMNQEVVVGMLVALSKGFNEYKAAYTEASRLISYLDADALEPRLRGPYARYLIHARKLP